MQNLLKISQQTLWQLLGKAVTAISTFIILGIVARSYGESGTGIFTLALTYLAIFFQLGDFGFNAHLLGQLHGDRGKLQLEWRQLLGTRLIWSVILVALAVGLLPVWPFTTNDFAKAVVFGCLAIVGSAVFTTSNLVFQTKLTFGRSVLASGLGTIFYLGLVAWLAGTKSPVAILVLAQALGWLAIGTLSLLLLKKFISNIMPIFDIRYSINLIKQSWPVAATLGLNIVYFRSDAFMIAYFRNASEVGIYNVAYQVFQIVLVLPAFIMNSYYPLMLGVLKKGQEPFNKQIKLAAMALLSLALLSTVATYYLAPWIIYVLTGGGFAGGVESLRILSLGFPAYFVTALFIWVMVAKKRYYLMLLIYAIGLLFNLLLNFIYIPQASFYAASWTTVLSEYLILILQLGSLVWL